MVKYSHRRYVQRPVYKPGSKVVSKAIGLNLLTEKVFGKKFGRKLYSNARKIGYLAMEYGCLGNAYNAVSKYQRSEGMKTATGMALAGLAAIVASKGLKA